MTPIHNNGSIQSADNYRPVSLMSQIIQVLYWRDCIGKTVLERLYWRDYWRDLLGRLIGETVLERLYWRDYIGEPVLERLIGKTLLERLLERIIGETYWRDCIGETYSGQAQQYNIMLLTWIPGQMLLYIQSDRMYK